MAIERPSSSFRLTLLGTSTRSRQAIFERLAACHSRRSTLAAAWASKASGAPKQTGTFSEALRFFFPRRSDSPSHTPKGDIKVFKNCPLEVLDLERCQGLVGKFQSLAQGTIRGPSQTPPRPYTTFVSSWCSRMLASSLYLPHIRRHREPQGPPSPGVELGRKSPIPRTVYW